MKLSFDTVEYSGNYNQFEKIKVLWLHVNDDSYSYIFNGTDFKFSKSYLGLYNPGYI